MYMDDLLLIKTLRDLHGDYDRTLEDKWKLSGLKVSVETMDNDERDHAKPLLLF